MNQTPRGEKNQRTLIQIAQFLIDLAHGSQRWQVAAARGRKVERAREAFQTASILDIFENNGVARGNIPGGVGAFPPIRPALRWKWPYNAQMQAPLG